MACAITLAAEGASGVLIADISVTAAASAVAKCEAAATNSRFRAVAIHVDVTLEDSVQSLMDQMTQAFGRMDYCINCAGIGAMAGADIVSTPLAEFQRFLDVNSRGTFLVTRMASIVMRAQELQAVSQSSPGRGTTRGAIVNLGSASSMVAVPGVLPYTTSKHATLGISKSAALDNAAHGIRVNCVCPTWTDTPMVRRAIEGVEGLAGLIERAVPLGRIATPEEVADTVVFLCSPRSSYVTGCGLLVDGGATLSTSR
ncbi:3-alpha-(Or 20-beta)-hydroxysteroid dehydrogenase [Colletotrichum musicola]|uniref:3-alpha-(Or 20-beta)-hydroxysteroid dehydrogenase n=1 Tax=Colletotrichum musicola TaxID=2175873 RepID=A0A8H6JHB6_9PEZI|nr:3-alpha-(Or 20-beta)-hydroxysteroid dehydrogenase [Colletotrichum musicola]